MFRRRPTLAAIILTAALVMPVGLYDAIWAILMDDRGASTLHRPHAQPVRRAVHLAGTVRGKLADRHGPCAPCRSRSSASSA